MARNKPLIPIFVPTLLGMAEVCVLLHVSRQRVQQLASESTAPENIPVSRPPFPAPTQILAMGSVWALDDIILWAERADRELDFAALEEFQSNMTRKGTAGRAAAAALLKQR